jgi:hypothetical protein
MTHLLIANLLLILIGPFVLVGGMALIAGASWPGLLFRPVPRRRPARSVGSAGWAVASWA